MSPFEDEPLPPRDLAEYVREVTRELAVAARDVGLRQLSDALEQAEREAAAALQNEAPEDAA